MQHFVSGFLVFMMCVQAARGTFEDVVLASYPNAHPSVMRQYLFDRQQPEFRALNFNPFLFDVLKDSQNALGSLVTKTEEPHLRVWQYVLEQQIAYARNPSSTWDQRMWKVGCEYLLMQVVRSHEEVLADDCFLAEVLLKATQAVCEHFSIKPERAEAWSRVRVAHNPYASPTSKPRLLLEVYKAWWYIFAPHDEAHPRHWGKLIQELNDAETQIQSYYRLCEANAAEISKQYDVNAQPRLAQLNNALAKAQSLHNMLGDIKKNLHQALANMKKRAEQVLAIATSHEVPQPVQAPNAAEVEPNNATPPQPMTEPVAAVAEKEEEQGVEPQPYAADMEAYEQKNDVLIGEINALLCDYQEASTSWSQEHQAAFKPKQDQLHSFLQNLAHLKQENEEASVSIAVLQKSMPRWKAALARTEKALSEAKNVFTRLQTAEQQAQQGKKRKEAASNSVAKSEGNPDAQKEAIQLAQVRLDELIPILDQSIHQVDVLIRKCTNLKEDKDTTLKQSETLDERIIDLKRAKAILLEGKKKQKKDINLDALNASLKAILSRIQTSKGVLVQCEKDLSTIQEFKTQRLALKKIFAPYTAKVVAFHDALAPLLQDLNGERADEKLTDDNKLAMKLAGTQLKVDAFDRALREIQRKMSSLAEHLADGDRKGSRDLTRLTSESIYEANKKNIEFRHTITVYCHQKESLLKAQIEELILAENAGKKITCKVQTKDGFWLDEPALAYNQRKLRELIYYCSHLNDICQRWETWRDKARGELIAILLHDLVEPELKDMLPLAKQLNLANSIINCSVDQLNKNRAFESVVRVHKIIGLVEDAIMMCDAHTLSAMVLDFRELSNIMSRELASDASKLNEQKAVIQKWWTAVQATLPAVLDGIAVYPPVQKMLAKPEAAFSGKKK